MKAEIISIGDEILIGQINNTNSVWMAQQLNLAGIQVMHMCTVPDREQAILDALEAAAGRADFVFITGGLGPTKDDVTKKIFARFFGARLITDKVVLDDVESFFAKRGRPLSPINRLQAEVPEGCFVIRNKNGTAPGMWMEKNKTVYISMPGVPYEMKGMMTDTILPKIRSSYVLPHIYHKSVLTQGIGESVLSEIISEWEDQLAEKNMSLAYLPTPGIVRLRISTKGDDQQKLQRAVEQEIEKLKTLVGKYIYGYEEYGQESPSLAQVLSGILREKKQTIAVAESCTGGYISSLFTLLPGASEVFKGGIVPYNNVAKHDLLQVDPSVFTTVGAVSQACVEQLAANALVRLKSDFAVSVSGIAGPAGATPEKPVGTVWVAVASREKLHSVKYQFGDNREQNIVMTANAAINLLRKFVLGEI